MRIRIGGIGCVSVIWKGVNQRRGLGTKIRGGGWV